jgi:hypothetical protein
MGNQKGWTNRNLVRKTVQFEDSDLDWIEAQSTAMDISSNEFIRRIISSFRLLQNFSFLEALRPAEELEAIMKAKTDTLAEDLLGKE